MYIGDDYLEEESDNEYKPDFGKLAIHIYYSFVYNMVFSVAIYIYKKTDDLFCLPTARSLVVDRMSIIYRS